MKSPQLRSNDNFNRIHYIDKNRDKPRKTEHADSVIGGREPEDEIPRRFWEQIDHCDRDHTMAIAWFVLKQRSFLF